MGALPKRVGARPFSGRRVGMELARALLLIRVMSFPLRALLWAAVLVAPGGVAVLPLLVADAARRYQQGRRDRALPPELPAPVSPELPKRQAA